MSLFRQLWLAVIASTLIAFAGSLIVSMVTARQYLEQQLAIKNNDNAASLALSAEREPMVMVWPALAKRLAIALPSAPVPPITPIFAIGLKLSIG